MKITAFFILFMIEISCGTLFAQSSAVSTISFEINIEPVFALKQSSREGGNVTLGPVLPGKGTVIGTVDVNISTNQGIPYRITHELESNFMSEKGYILPSEKVRFSVSEGVNGGRSEVMGEQPLAKEKMVIFSSNSRGDGDQFTVTYFVGEQKIIPAGRYRAQINIKEQIY